MKKLNKSKLKSVATSFKNGALVSLTDKPTLILSAFVGGLKSEGDFTKGLYEGVKVLAQAAAVNGVGHIVIDELFGTDEELELTED